MLAGKAADTLYMTEGCFERATGTKNKELFLIDGATHWLEGNRFSSNPSDMDIKNWTDSLKNK